MTKKDYEAIAEAIRRIRKIGVDCVPEANNTLILVERELAGIMAEDNPRFNRDQFLAACRGEDFKTERGTIRRYAVAQ
jgi:hypothetical protein